MVVKLNGIKYDCPSCYEELTVHHHQRIVSEWEIDKPVTERDWFKLFCILTNTDFKSFHATSTNEVTIWNAIKWFDPNYVFAQEIPKVLQIGDRVIDLPESLGDLSIGQNVHARQILDQAVHYEDKDGSLLEHSRYSAAVAIYLQPLFDGSKFDFNRAMELEKDILNMPAYLIRPIGFFIVTNVLQYGRTPGRNWLRTLTNHIRTRRRQLLLWLSGNGLYLMRTLG